MVGDLSVETISEGVHSGDASGIVADSFRVARQLLSRLEDPDTGRIVAKELQVEIPAGRLRQTEATVGFMGNEVWNKFPWIMGCNPVEQDNVQLALNRTWRPQLAVTGAEGLPDLVRNAVYHLQTFLAFTIIITPGFILTTAQLSAGNVLRPRTVLKLSLRVPPTLSAPAASAYVKELLEKVRNQAMLFFCD